MKKALPEKMFAEAEQSRLSMLRSWVLEQGVTEIEMNEQQFWNFAGLQPARGEALGHLHGPSGPRAHHARRRAEVPRYVRLAGAGRHLASCRPRRGGTS